MISPACYVLVGPPGCGKSTWCTNNLSSMNDPVVISSDAVMEQIAADNNVSYAEAFQLTDYERDIVPRLSADIIRAAHNRRDIVLDLTNRNLRERLRFRHLIPTDYQFIGVHFEFDLDEVRQRVKERGERTGKVISDEAMNMHFAEYIPPQIFEFNDIIYVPRNNEGAR